MIFLTNGVRAAHRFATLSLALCASVTAFGQWPVTHSGNAGGADLAHAVAVDSQGRVIVAGFEQSVSNGRDMVVMQLNATGGAPVWLKTFDGPHHKGDEAMAVALDASDNVYVAVNSMVLDPGSRDIVLIKYDSSGNTLWTQTYNGGGFADDLVYAMTVDSNGDVILAGETNKNGTYDFLTLKYSANSTFRFAKTYNGSANSSDWLTRVGCDSANNIYVVGTAARTGGSEWNLIKYNSNGVQQFRRAYSGPSTQGYGTGLAVDANGNTFVTGSRGNWGVRDWYTVAYSSSGQVVWQKKWGQAGQDQAFDIALSNTGNVIVVGENRNNLVSRYMTVCYDAATGVVNWQRPYAGLTAGTDNRATQIVCDGAGNSYVTGASDGDMNTNTGYKITTIKYGPTGNVIWKHVYSDPSGNNAVPTRMAIRKPNAGSPAGPAYVCGFARPASNLGGDWVVLKN